MRVMCTGRIDPAFILRSFSNGADGVFIGGCHLNECNYITHGNFYALRITKLCKTLLERLGVNPDRLRIEFISGGEGSRFADIMNDFSDRVNTLGPLGKGEELEPDNLKFALEAASKIVPYIKLAERERFKVQFETEAEYDEYFGSEEFNKLFDATIGEKLVTSQIALLLQDKPLSTGEISELLGLSPSELSRHMNNSTRQGLVKYDEELKSYALA